MKPRCGRGSSKTFLPIQNSKFKILNWSSLPRRRSKRRIRRSSICLKPWDRNSTRRNQCSSANRRQTARGRWILRPRLRRWMATQNSKLIYRASLSPKSIGGTNILLGTAFSFVHLLDFLGEQNLSFRLPPGSRVMETGGYKSHSRTMPKNELHALITERLGVPQSHIVCEYGMSELNSQAYDTEISTQNSKLKIQNLERRFHFPPWARVQVISPETNREVADGETGLIRVFDLANVFSVMAIQTEDLGVRHGDDFELLGRAQFAEPRGCSLMSIESK